VGRQPRVLLSGLPVPIPLGRPATEALSRHTAPLTTITQVSRAVLSVAVVASSLLVGCSATVAGRAVRTPTNTVERALPNSAELKRALGLPFESDSLTEVGGIGPLRGDKDEMSPLDCAGVTHAGYGRTYQGAPLRASARGFWTTPQDSDDRVNVVISVVELDSPSSAQSWYVKTAAQWAQCQGVTVTESTSAVSFLQNIRRITDSDGTLTAELSVSTDNGLMTPQLNRRAFIATSQYLIDAEIFGTLRYADASNLDASAVAHLTAGKLS
jgi:PknH-like extracellular domain